MAEKQTAVIQKPGQVSPLMVMGARFSVEPVKLLEVLRGTVIKPGKNGPATNEEVAAFCIVANQYGLNPFTREIHAFTDGQRGVVPIVGIDGWTHIVNASGEFDGCEFDEVDGENGKPDRITCRMFVKGRDHPVCATERFAECYRNTIPWNTMPYRMLRHKAYMQAARYAFGLSGIFDEDEARDIIANAKTVQIEREPVTMPVEKQAQSGPTVDSSTPNGGPPATKDKPDDLPMDAPEPKPAVAEDKIVAEIKAMLGHLRPSQIQKCAIPAGIKFGEGEAWEMASAEAIKTFHSLLLAESKKAK